MSSFLSYGSEWYALLQNLGIHTGKVGPDQMNAWYDTNCQDTMDFLHWFQMYMGNNALTGIEQQAYQQLVDNNLVFSGDELEAAVNEIDQKYDDILDLENNEFDIDCLQDNLAMVTDDMEHLEKCIATHQDLNKILVKKHRLKLDEEIQSQLKKENNKKQCLVNCGVLDEYNTQLEQQLKKYGNQLIYFDMTLDPTFISNMSLDGHSKYVNNILTYMNDSIKNDFKLTHYSDIITFGHTTIDSINNTNESEEKLEVMQNRITNSIINSHKAIEKQAELEAALNYLTNLEFFEISNCVLEGSNLYQLEALVISKREKINVLSMEAKEAAVQTATKYANLPKLQMLQTEIAYCRNKSLLLSNVSASFEKILSYECLVALMHAAENNNVKFTDTFIRDTFHHISYKVQHYQNRIDIMDNIIGEYNDYKMKPFEQKYSLIKHKLNLITDENNNNFNFQDAIKIVDDFKNKINTCERRVFLDDFTQFGLECKAIEARIKTFQTFLMNGPTTQYVIVPYKIYKILNELDSSFIKQESLIKECMLYTNTAEKKLSGDKWMAIGRQLWMYFITSPKKVISYIEQIEDELQNRRNKSLN